MNSSDDEEMQAWIDAPPAEEKEKAKETPRNLETISIDIGSLSSAESGDDDDSPSSSLLAFIEDDAGARLVREPPPEEPIPNLGTPSPLALPACGDSKCTAATHEDCAQAVRRQRKRENERLRRIRIKEERQNAAAAVEGKVSPAPVPVPPPPHRPAATALSHPSPPPAPARAGYMERVVDHIVIKGGGEGEVEFIVQWSTGLPLRTVEPLSTFIRREGKREWMDAIFVMYVLDHTDMDLTAVFKRVPVAE